MKNGGWIMTYTANHAHLPGDNDAWRRKAKYPMQPKNIKGNIAVRVKMGTVLPGRVNIKMIGVSTYKATQ